MTVAWVGNSYCCALLLAQTLEELSYRWNSVIGILGLAVIYALHYFFQCISLVCYLTTTFHAHILSKCEKRVFFRKIKYHNSKIHSYLPLDIFIMDVLRTCLPTRNQLKMNEWRRKKRKEIEREREKKS